MIIGKSAIGLKPRIGMRSWLEWVSLTGNATLRKNFSMDALTGNGLLGLTTLMDSLPGNADLSERYLMDALTGNASLITAIILHGNANLMKQFTADALPGNALLSERISMSGLAGNGLLSERVGMSSLPGNALLRLAYYMASLPGNGLLSQRNSMTSLTGNAQICLQILMDALTGNGLVSEKTTMSSLPGNANIVVRYAIPSLPGSAYLHNPRYWAIGPEDDLIDLSGKVYDPKPSGCGLKTSKTRLSESRRISLLDSGLDGPERSFTVIFSSDPARRDFQEMINNDSEDLVLFAGRSDRYYNVKMVSVDPGNDDMWRGQATLDITCLMEDPYLYHVVDQGVDLGACSLPQDGTSKYNFGSALAPFLFKIGGQYNSGQLTLPFAKIMDGATEETSLALGPGLLSNEYSELTLDGWHRYYLTHTYVDLYSNNNYWQYDAVRSGCSLAGGQVSVPSGAWFYYKFQGYPLKENIKLRATITKGAGSPIIQYFTDLAAPERYTSIPATEIVSGVTTDYYLTGTEKASTIYIQFYSPPGSSMTIQDVSFSMERDVSAQYLQMPSCPVGETRILRVTGAGSTKAKIRSTFRARWQPQ